MAIRTTKQAVIDLMAPGRDYDGRSDLTGFIATANSRINWIVANAATYRRTVPSAADLELIERWLSAHFYKQSDQQLQSSNAGRSSGSFRGMTAEGLKSTLYGRTAVGMDTTRMLSAIDEGRIAVGIWLGKAPSGQTDYVDRD